MRHLGTGPVRRENRRPLTLAIATLFTLLPSIVLAEEGEAKLKEMTVSEGSLIEEARQRSTLGGLTADKPMAGTVLQREELDVIKSVTSLTDMLWRVPGVSKSRNMRIASGGKNYSENRVDGMRVRNTGTYSFVDQTNSGDIERVEVITGPGSVLQSSYAFGGTINVITRDAPKQKELSLSQEVGDGGFYRSGVSTGDSFANGFGYLMSANITRNRGWRVQSTDDKEAFSLKLGGKPDERSNLYFRLEYLYDDYVSPGQLTEKEWNQNWQNDQGNVYGRTKIKYVTPSMQYKRAVGENGELTLGWSERFTDSVTFGSTATFTAFSNNISVSRSTETGTQAIYRHDFEPLKTRLYVGFESMRSISSAKRYANVYGALPAVLGSFQPGALANSNNNESRETHETPFVNVEFSPWSPLRFNLGVRADKIRYTVDDRATTNKDNTKVFKKDVVKGGVTYELNKDNLIWASAAEGFLAPGVSSLLASGNVGNTNNAGGNGYIPAADLKPEESMTYQLGFRGFLPVQRLRYDVTLYKTVIENMVVNRDCTAAEKAGPVASRCYQKRENAGMVTAKGLETGLSYAAASWLDLGLSHTLAFTTYNKWEAAGGANYNGKSYNFTPKHHLNLRFTFKPAPGWSSELEGDYETEYWLDSENTQTYHRPNIYNLRTSYTDPGNRWSAWAHIMNLMDRKYADRMSMSGTTRVIGDGYAPRMLRVGVSYNF